MDRQVKITKDGSSTLYVPTLDETYHSLHGAVQESRYVFIGQGLDYFVKQSSKSPITVLEVGLGTGLNAWLSWDYASRHHIKLHYTGLEPFPVDPEMLKKLNYDDLADLVKSPFTFQKLHEVSWERVHALSHLFLFEKIPQRIQDFKGPGPFDVIYFDAFAPGKQPDIWSIKVLDSVKALMQSGSCLVTYSAQGQFRRDLKSLGFAVNSLAGPPGKKEMTRAELV